MKTAMKMCMVALSSMLLFAPTYAITPAFMEVDEIASLKAQLATLKQENAVLAQGVDKTVCFLHDSLLSFAQFALYGLAFLVIGLSHHFEKDDEEKKKAMDTVALWIVVVGNCMPILDAELFHGGKSTTYWVGYFVTIFILVSYSTYSKHFANAQTPNEEVVK